MNFSASRCIRYFFLENFEKFLENVRNGKKEVTQKNCLKSGFLSVDKQICENDEIIQ